MDPRVSLLYKLHFKEPNMNALFNIAFAFLPVNGHQISQEQYYLKQAIRAIGSLRPIASNEEVMVEVANDLISNERMY